LKALSGDVKEAVKYAIDVGYRHVDTAFIYENEAEVGAAVREKINDGTVKRGDLFIVTKVSTSTLPFRCLLRGVMECVCPPLDL
jgi:diketogulonate reductase-like aldo/keto reductase